MEQSHPDDSESPSIPNEYDHANEFPSEVIIPDEYMLSSSDVPKLEMQGNETVSEDGCKICGGAINICLVLETCGHSFCHDCFSDFLSLKIASKDVRKLTCPAFQCQTSISTDLLTAHLTSEQLEKLTRFRTELDLESDPDFRWCPRPDCVGYDYARDLKEKLTCNTCGFIYCAYCQSEWHGAKQCPASLDKQFNAWLHDVRAKFCPQCKMKVEKNEGCPHMTCVHCSYEWCWNCGEDFHNHNTCLASKRHWADNSWTNCFIMLFLPVIVPFLFVFATWEARRDVRRTHPGCAGIAIMLFLMFLVLIFTPVCFVVLFCICGHLVLADAFGRHLRHGNYCGNCIKTIIYLLAGFFISPFLDVGGLCFVGVSPIVGVVMLVLKTYIRQFPPPAFQSKVPGYPIG